MYTKKQFKKILKKNEKKKKTCNGSVSLFVETVNKNGVFSVFYIPEMIDCKIILSYAIFELILTKIIPGSTFRGPVTATGHIPKYVNNGVTCYLISIITFIVGGYFNLWNLSIVYQRLCYLLSLSSAIALTLCAFLVFKGGLWCCVFLFFHFCFLFLFFFYEKIKINK